MLVGVLAYLSTKNGSRATVQSAADRILAGAAQDGRFLKEAHAFDDIARWSAGSLTPEDLAYPQLVAATLLWADTWKNGS